MRTIQLTNIQAPAIVRAAYRNSAPRGLGLPNSLSDEEVSTCIQDNIIYMDYVQGRGCKFRATRVMGQWTMLIPWYDHTENELNNFLTDLSLPIISSNEPHNPSCACDDCEAAR